MNNPEWVDVIALCLLSALLAAKPAIPSIHVKRSAELWLGTFEQAVFVYLAKDGANGQAHALGRAHSLADLVVDAFEQRWPGVKL